MLACACQGLIGGTQSQQPDDIDDPRDSPTWDEDIQCDVPVAMARGGCTSAGCHGDRYAGGLDLLSPGVEERLVGVPSTTQACRGRLLVDRAAPSSSLFLEVLEADLTAKEDTCSTLMPLGGSEISAEDQACFARWVDKIVAQSSGGDDLASLFEAAPVESYAAKVKTLTTGEPLTEAELAAMTNDTSTLRSWVTTWVDSPRFLDKMRPFFATTLQVSETRELAELFGPQTIRARDDRLQDAMTESVVQTAIDIVDRREPLHTLLTTRRWWMSTALLVATTYLDMRGTELAATHTLTYGTEPLPLAQSIATRTWRFPSVPDTCVVRPFDEPALLAIFFGLVDCRNVPNINLVDDAPLTPADFADWRYVELEPASSPTRYYDLLTLRGATRVGVVNPRIGFFSSPGFQANWLTNADNAFRVTINQTLIAALDATFSPVDDTPNLLPSAVDTEHADTTSACYGCHKYMDPMRGYFSSSLDTTFQRAPEGSATAAAFAFLGKTHDGGDVDDFAASIATHPRFAMAWAQKLCMYATAHRCSEGDPELRRIVAAFESSGFDFKTLAVELFSSPLVTEASFVDTFASVPTFVSISRRDHLCAALRVRTGIADICERPPVATALDLVPTDGFARGTTDIIASSSTTPFHLAATNKLCLAVAPIAVTKTGPYTTDTPAATIDKMVTDLMGLPVGHSRRTASFTALQAHYDAVIDAGHGKGDALRSAFVAACSSANLLAQGM